MSTSVWSGNVNLENICLNASNLNNDSSLQLPFSITKGTIRSLSLSVDWKTWYARKHPINIRVSGVVLQCSPREEDDWFQAFGAVASSLEAEDVARRKLQKSIDDIVSIQEDPALMAIWAPLFASVHVELKDLTIKFYSGIYTCKVPTFYRTTANYIITITIIIFTKGSIIKYCSCI